MGSQIKKGDRVVVIAGAAKGTEGVVERVVRDQDRLVVSGVNKVKRHTRAIAQVREGGIITKSMPIHRSNVMLVDPSTGKGTRVRSQVDAEGRKVRVAVKSGTPIDVK